MRWFLRAALALLAVAGVALRLHHLSGQGEAERSARLSRVLAGSLTGPVRNVTVPHQEVTFAAPVAGCRRPLTIAPVPTAFVSDEAAPESAPAGSRIHYAYLDWLADKPDRVAVFWRHAANRLATAFGLGPYENSAEMLYIAEDPDCRLVEKTDWRRYWTRS